MKGQMVDIALALAAAGRPVYPLRYDRRVALTKHGSADATVNAHKICVWWARWPSARVGVLR
jgi:hypothetical protein